VTEAGPQQLQIVSAALAVAEGYVDADGGKGIGLTDAMNVALAAATAPTPCSPPAATSA
jgi:hypothetical protein